MNRKLVPLIIALVSITAIHVFADGKKKAKTAKPRNVATIPADCDSIKYHFFLFPEFYTYWPIDNNDTTLKFECYDAAHDFINMDTLQDIDNIAHICFVKDYPDYTQTTIDAEGKPHAKLIVRKLFDYDRTGPGMWQSLDLAHNDTELLKEERNIIVRTDTTLVMDPITFTCILTVRKYYRVLKTDSALHERTDAPVRAGDETGNRGNGNESPEITYTVPDFYYYQPVKNHDTTLSFRCYDYQDSLLPQVDDYDSVRYYSLFKQFTDSTHTFIDNDGVKKYLPVANIIKRYDRISANRWMMIEYPGNKYEELTEYKNVIVSTDTTAVIDPITDKTTLKIFRHYKVVK